MTRWEKCDFWFLPTLWALCWGVPFLISASFLVALGVSFLIHLQGYIHHPEWFKNLEPSLVFLTAMLVISGAILIYPVSIFRKMTHSKKESGSLYPSGEELTARRFRREHPAV